MFLEMTFLFEIGISIFHSHVAREIVEVIQRWFLTRKIVAVRKKRSMNIVYVIESAAYGVFFTSCLCQKPERARYQRVRAFDTNND